MDGGWWGGGGGGGGGGINNLVTYRSIIYLVSRLILMENRMEPRITRPGRDTTWNEMNRQTGKLLWHLGKSSQ